MLYFHVYLRFIRVLDRDALVDASQRLEGVEGCIQRGNCAVKAKCGDLRFRGIGNMCHLKRRLDMKAEVERKALKSCSREIAYTIGSTQEASYLKSLQAQSNHKTSETVA
jgi:hypothetical protein